MLVEDHVLVREGTRELLDREEDIQVVAEAGDGEEAVRLAEAHRPDVILMDIALPKLNGLEATKRIKASTPEPAILVLTAYDDDEYIFEGLRAGALGYLLKDAAPDVLYNAIRAAARGESVLQPAVAAKVVSQFARMAPTPSPEQALVEPLSEREIEVLALIADGQTNREIAGELYIASGTVKNHVTNILGKLGVRDRTQAALKARELGLI